MLGFSLEKSILGGILPLVRHKTTFIKATIPAPPSDKSPMFAFTEDTGILLHGFIPKFVKAAVMPDTSIESSNSDPLVCPSKKPIKFGEISAKFHAWHSRLACVIESGVLGCPPWLVVDASNTAYIKSPSNTALFKGFSSIAPHPSPFITPLLFA